MDFNLQMDKIRFTIKNGVNGVTAEIEDAEFGVKSELFTPITESDLLKALASKEDDAISDVCDLIEKLHEGNEIDCPNCDGTGEIETSWNDYSSNSPIYDKEECDKCNGSKVTELNITFQ